MEGGGVKIILVQNDSNMHMHSVEDTQAASERLKCILPRNENVGHKRMLGES